MKEPVVADSTCLIGLERIGRLELLPGVFEPVFVPPEVHREFGISLPWLTVEDPANRALVLALAMVVDNGEAEAIALAHEHSWPVILDDRHARGVARRLGTAVIGTVGLLLRAKQSGVIPFVRPLLDALDANGLHRKASERRSPAAGR